MLKAKTFLHEEARELPVLATYEVVVVGGGIAGVAAALAAARTGCKVCLIEKVCALGGLATVGNVIVYLPLCDGRGHQVIGGIGEELLKLSVDDVPEFDEDLRLEVIPDAWKNPKASVEARAEKRYRTAFNPVTYEYKLEKLLLKNRVHLYYDMHFASVLKEGNQLRAVVVETKAGRMAIGCSAVVDCTGDADVCQAAGEKTVSISGNVRCGWYYYLDADRKAHLVMCSDNPHKLVMEDGTRKPNFRVDDPDQVTKIVLGSRQMMMDQIAAKRAEGGLKIQPIMSPTIPCFRMSRRLAGKVTLKESDDHRWFDDALGMTPDWRKPGPIFCLPLRALAAVKTGNLITAGRCLSTTGDTWDALRVIPTCAVSGEAAGTAAAFLARDKEASSFAELDIAVLQKYLIRKNGILDKKLLSL